MSRIEQGKDTASERVDGRYKQHIAYDRMKQAIISGEFPPEKLLVERELCELLGVSRTPVREALRRLTSEGLVESYPGRGVRVTRVSAEDVDSIYELKQALECMAVRLCIERMSGEECDQLGACLEAHRVAYSEKRYDFAADMDLRFHTLLVEFARSPKIEEHAKTILVQTRRMSQLSVFDTSYTDQFIREHRAIYEAICRSDVPAAEAAVRIHVASICDFQRKRIDRFFAY